MNNLQKNILVEILKNISISLVIVLLVLFSTTTLNAQNLITNGDFEFFTECPNLVSQLELALPWINPFEMTTPDYYNACANDYDCLRYPGNASIPCNVVGYEPAHSGNGYAGIITYYRGTYYEYLQTPLSEPLEAGTTYYLSFYVSLADSGVNVASANLGAFFSDSLLPDNGGFELLDYVTPQVIDHSLMDLRNGWTRIDGLFTAQGGEQFITLGCFDTIGYVKYYEQPIKHPINSHDRSYYYLDDVSLVKAYFKGFEKDTLYVCPNDSFILHANAGPNAAYRWQDGTNSDSLKVAQQGLHWVDIAKATGTQRYEVYISYTSFPIPNNTREIEFCKGNTLQLNIDTIPHASYLWSTGDTTSTLFITQETTLYLTTQTACNNRMDTISVRYR